VSTNNIEDLKSEVIGRLAKRPYVSGDQLPPIGSIVLVSGANYDVESDQHRSYYWRKVIGYANGDQFVCLQTRDCWPTVERMTNCWFAHEPFKNTAEGVLSAAAPELLAVLKGLRRAYVNLIESGRDRIIALDGTCDPVDVMEANDPWLREVTQVIAKATGSAT